MPSSRFPALRVAALIGVALGTSLAWGYAQAPASKQATQSAKGERAQAKKARRPQAVEPGPAPVATSIERLKTLPGFQVELVYAVPREEQGSWVNLTVDPKGRLITSDQYGQLYRVTPSPLGGPPDQTKVERIPVDLGEAQGLLWAFDSLYVVVNRGGKYASGLYRVRDTNNDDQLDQVESLRKLEGGGEHGPHAVVLSPDGKSLYVIAGNATRLPDLDGSLVPLIWGEDNLLPRMVDGSGFMKDEKAPGGYVCKVTPDGKSWELVSMGYRNPYDMAFNRDGELFTYDSDMEWDMNLPWYRPTRVCQAVSGSDFGYRNGAGKWPTYYEDSLPPVVNIGPGSPTGVGFGYGAKFPVKYQDAFYISDWSYGKLYAVHLKPAGAGYTADVEEFVTGVPLPLTDVIVRPQDGALYFTIGGRRTTSGLYRVVYKGTESTDEISRATDGAEARAKRRELEAFHGRRDPRAVETAWPYLNDSDRFLRYAARVAIEFQDPAAWRERALAETQPLAALEALLALVRVSAQDPAHRGTKDPKPDPALKTQILERLGRFDWNALDDKLRLDLLRVYAVLFNRMGRPDDETVNALAARFDAGYPAKGRELNIDLCNMLVYLGEPKVIGKTLALIAQAPTQEEQIDLARALRVLSNGWTLDQRRAYFEWIVKAHNFKGGHSFAGFLRDMKRDAVATLSSEERDTLKPLLEAQAPAQAQTPAAPPRAFVKTWTLDELVPMVEEGLKTKRDFERGRALFGAVSCAGCHRFDTEGGAVGPDLTGVAGRFSVRDLLESIVVPNKVISDQYQAVEIATDDGKVVVGRIVNLNGDTISVNTNMLEPDTQTSVNRRRIEVMRPSAISMMPEGLLNTMNRDEVLDLMAYLMSRGDRKAAALR